MKQLDALEVLKLGEHVYLTGSAGSGKTHVLNQYISYVKQQGGVVAVTASTGVAATQVDGITLNAWAGIGVRSHLSQLDISELLKRQYLRKRFVETNVLIIDEISMLPAASLDMVDSLCRAARGSNEPFGGIQIVLCGDFFQLPPVTKEVSDLQFVYKSKVWEQLNLRVCYLDQVYRQDDEEFLQILQEIRTNTVSKDSIKRLAGRLYSELDTISTRLYTHNTNVDAINEAELSKLTGQAFSYSLKAEGNEVLAEVLKRNSLVPTKLKLKIGAQVMFVKNNFDKGYVNGTLGKVVGFTDKNFPIVETVDQESVIITPSEWVFEEDDEVKARIRQLPLRLAWAMTIHKSQGMTIDAAEIDLSKPFVAGMGYVALSRVRKLNGIRLMGLNHKALQVNEEISELDKEFKEKSKQTEEEINSLPWLDIEVSHAYFRRKIKEHREQQNTERRRWWARNKATWSVAN